MKLENEIQSPKEKIQEEEMPEELKQSLRAIIGERPESFKQEFKLNAEAYPQLHEETLRAETAQEEFIKKKDPVKKKIRFKENKMYVLDLTDPVDLNTYQEILDTITDPESGTILSEKLQDPQILIDPKSKKGFRAIVCVKTAKPEHYLKKEGSGYEKISEKDKQRIT